MKQQKGLRTRGQASLTERRRKEKTHNEHHKNLCLAQLKEVAKLEEDGFKLLCVRCLSKKERLAVLFKGSEFIYINSDGEPQLQDGVSLRS
jgi:hypothetical protein